MTSDAGSTSPRLRRKGRRTPVRTLSVAGRTVETRGLEGSFWADFYNNAMMVSWGAFLGYAALVFVATNAVFAALYAVGDQPVANDGGNNLPLLFFFSIETLATVGYGDMHPQTTYGHVLASVEMFSGLFLSALLTGLIFARFSRPRARFVFAEVVTVALHEGVPTIIVRVANARQNMITNATAKLWIIRSRVNAEGVTYRGFEPLRLQKAENPIFALSWSLFHALDATSPLRGATADDLLRAEASLLLAVTGIDEVTGQQVQDRCDYPIATFRWNHRYVDIVGRGPGGDTLIDYTHFHKAEPLTASAAMDLLAPAG